MKRRLKINGFIMFCAFLLIAAFPAIFFRKERASYSAFDQFFEILGVALILLGQTFRVSARGYKSEHSQNGHSLIQTGPYALVRNPMYLGILLIGTGIVFMLFEWWTICIFLLVFTTRYILLIFKEERRLLEVFPKDYRDYQKSVPRIFPPLTKIAQKDISEYLPLKLAWVKKEIGTILTVLFLALFVESWEDLKKKGAVIYFKEAVWYLVIIILFICVVIYLAKQNAVPEKNGSDKSKTD